MFGGPYPCRPRRGPCKRTLRSGKGIPAGASDGTTARVELHARRRLPEGGPTFGSEAEFSRKASRLR